jgi:hypothetical protein
VHCSPLNIFFSHVEKKLRTDLFKNGFEVYGSSFQEEGLSNPGGLKHRGLITPPLEKNCLFAQSEHPF